MGQRRVHAARDRGHRIRPGPTETIPFQLRPGSLTEQKTDRGVALKRLLEGSGPVGGFTGDQPESQANVFDRRVQPMTVLAQDPVEQERSLTKPFKAAVVQNLRSLQLNNRLRCTPGLPN
jgi:hypothetical protein